jgi:hypothetical protein
MDHLLHEITLENIPEKIGGKFRLFNEPFEFNTKPGSNLCFFFFYFERLFSFLFPE